MGKKSKSKKIAVVETPAVVVEPTTQQETVAVAGSIKPPEHSITCKWWNGGGEMERHTLHFIGWEKIEDAFAFWKEFDAELFSIPPAYVAFYRDRNRLPWMDWVIHPDLNQEDTAA
jgi:hypothetical protein